MKWGKRREGESERMDEISLLLAMDGGGRMERIKSDEKEM